MIKIEIYELAQEGGVLSLKEYAFREFDTNKFEELSSYIVKVGRKFTPRFVFCLDIEVQEAIQVLRNIINGYDDGLYRLSDGTHYFRSGNLIFNIYEE